MLRKLSRDSDPFKGTDKIINRTVIRLTRRFRRLRARFTLLSFDEIEALNEIRTAYEDIYEITVSGLTECAKHGYAYVDDYVEDFLVQEWIERELKGFDPCTRYVFNDEADRKRARLFEAVMAAQSANVNVRKKYQVGLPVAEVDKAMRLWARQFEQTADDITVGGMMEALKKNKVERVEWVTQRDGRVCEDCRALDGKIFDLEDAPALPQHYNCRCFLIPVLVKS